MGSEMCIRDSAMHSCVETAGEKDTAYMVKAMTAFYNADIRQTADGMYTF